jgi:nitrogen regulatory protein PII
MRKKNDDRRVKLLVSIINKADQGTLTETINRYATAMHFSGIGHGTARSHHRSYFGIDDVEKRVTFSLIPSHLEHTLLSAIGRELKLYLLGKGIAFTMPLSGISNIVEEPILASPDKEQQTRHTKSPVSKKEKSSMHELVIAVVNEKYSDAALEAARSAGATGATIFHTHSVDNAKIEQAMGASIPADSDSIFFLTTKEYKLKIMEAIRDSAGLKTEGSAVIFSIPVDDLVGIGRFDEQMVEE